MQPEFEAPISPSQPSLIQAKVSDKEKEAAARVHEEDFYSGGHDLVRAQILSGLDEDLTFPELIAIIQATGSCALTMTKEVAENLFDVIDQDSSGHMTIQELREGLVRQDVIQTLNELKQPVLGKMLKPPKPHFCSEVSKDPIKDTFEVISNADGVVNRVDAGGVVNTDGKGEIVLKRDELSNWLVDMREDRINYYYRVLLLKVHAYTGHGMEPGVEPGAKGLRQFGITRGWWSDFKYFASNHHPLLQIFRTDYRHPFTKGEKAMCFFVTLCTTFVGTGYVLYLRVEGIEKTIYNLVYATLPTMVMQKLSYLLMACPCTLHDESASSPTFTKVINIIESCGTIGGRILVAAAVGFIALGCIFFTWANRGQGEAIGYWIASVIQTWILWVVFVACTFFLPSEMLSKKFAFVGKITFGSFVIGQWHLERIYVQSVIRKKIKAVGESNLLRPDVQEDLEAPSSQQQESPLSSPVSLPSNSSARVSPAMPSAEQEARFCDL